jgi:DNA-binding NtrC family response regulator
MPAKTILVVDDEKNIRLTLARALEQLGHPIATAVNAEDAWHRLEEQDVGVMLLDLKMPGMDGMDLLRRVAERYPAVRVIIITAHGTVPDAVEAMKLGAVDFIQKPFTTDEVREIVQRAASRAGPPAMG